ncbi:MAG: tyrosine--tRNA ligase [Alphaproteobacteria bacterium]|nr:tyrosine--tRNA ligase [Alphaproteobacteria bacterium]
MARYKSEFVNIIVERGYLHQATDLDGLDVLAAAGPIAGYIGFDATADSLHVGSLVQIMLLRRLQQTGHRPIVLMGGGTTRIGDPSGKDETRRLLSDEQISSNITGIRRAFGAFVDFGVGPTEALLVNNADWLDGLAYIPFLREVGQHFTINRMLTFESVKLRLDREQPLTFLEFNYMILQAYDFVELARRNGCVLQMGGSDQWGNIVNGVELGRRLDDKELQGVTTRLITTASGTKMGKTAAGAVWLAPERVSPYEYWQFWRNTEDGDVGRFLRLFTDLPLAEITRLEALGGAEINEAKKVLATEATVLAHGHGAAGEAAESARLTFEEGTFGEALSRIEVARVELAQGLPLFSLLTRAGLAASGGEARRLIRGGGARVNDTVATDENARITLANLSPDGIVKLSAGRKRHALIVPA